LLEEFDDEPAGVPIVGGSVFHNSMILL
jgi:hypothetical protein